MQICHDITNYMASEILAIPEENLLEVIDIIRTGLDRVPKVTKTVAKKLNKWCDDEEAHLPMDRTSVGHFIKWVVNDIVKEESDTAKASGIDLNKATGELTKAARMWFFKHELEIF